MKFEKIKIEGWNQLHNVDIALNKKLTVITGANGSGKTTILNILAKHHNWNVASTAVPKKNYLTGLSEWIAEKISKNYQGNQIGEISYSNKSSARLAVPDRISAQYNVEINNISQVRCFYIPSHRSVFRYAPIGSIPNTQDFNKELAFQQVSNATKNRYLGGNDQASNFHIKQILISWNIFGYGNPTLESNEKYLDYFNGFEEVLKAVLPEELGFNKIKINNFEVLLDCKSGSFLIDAASGGISTIIDMAWQIYMFSSDKNEEFTVLVDEIENHLHPTLQRQLLSKLLNAFPLANFIVSTHSPLVVSSVRDANIYVLRYNNDGKVISEHLDFYNEAKTASEILDEVLGVSFTMPVWAEKILNTIIDKYSKTLMDANTFQQMREDLRVAGLEKLMPQAIVNLLGDDGCVN